MSSGSRFKEAQIHAETGLSVGYSYTKVWSGSNDPKKVIPNDYIMTHESWNYTLREYEMYLTSNPGVIGASGQCSSFSWLSDLGWRFPPLEVDFLEARALLKIRQISNSTNFSSALALAEGKESLALIGSSSKRISSAIKALYRRDPVALAKALGIFSAKSTTRRLRVKEPIPLTRGERAAGSTRRYSRTKLRTYNINTLKRYDIDKLWLEFQFGVVPLLATARDGAVRLAEVINSVKSTRVDVNVSVSGEPTRKWDKESWSITKSLRVTGSLEHSDIRALNVADLLDPAVLYTAFPLSFVVDWFVPIGAMLEALTVRTALTGKLFTATFAERVAMYEASSWKIELDSSWTGTCYPHHLYGAGGGFYKFFRLQRIPNYSLSVTLPPHKQWRGFQNEVGKIVSAVALITSRKL